MKLITRIAVTVLCLSAVGLGRLAIATPFQLHRSAGQQIVETNGNPKINQEQHERSASADKADQSKQTMAEPPDGDGDGETNDDG